MSTAQLRFRAPLPLLFSRAPWAAFWYLLGSMFLGTLWFSITFTLLATGLTLGLFWVGLPVLVAALATTRALAEVERRRIGTVGGPRISTPYRPVSGTGFRARLGQRLRDPATRRDTVLLVVLWPAVFVIDTVAVVFWLACFALMSLPIWYRYVPNTFDNGTKAHGVAFGNFPDGPHAGHHWGFFVGDMRSALLAAAVGLVLLVVAGNYLLVALARAHGAITRSLLGPAIDPLAAARQMLIADPELSRR
ncbi:MAG TPA: sensor domain-containing protein [Jatrophihabitantaceae bacterium]|jgi:hypothetical protein